MIARGLTLALLIGTADILFVAATREPRELEAVAALLVGIGLVAFALAAGAFYWVPSRIGLGRRRRRMPTALRRGALVAVAAVALALLRVVDALSLVTAIFVLAALAALEGLLSTRG